MTRQLYRLSLACYWAIVLAAIIGAPVQAGALEVTSETDIWLTIEQDDTLVVIYGNSNRSCEEPGADPYLWLYLDDQLIAEDDDSNHGAGQCFSSKLYVTLDAGTYRLHAGYCCILREDGYDGGSYELLSEVQLSAATSTTSTSTTSTTTSTTTTTTTTTTSTTTSTSTSTTTTTTTTAPTTTTSTTVPPATSTTSTTSTSTTTTSTTSSTTTSSTTTTTVLPLPVSTSSTTTSTTSTSTTTSSTPPTSVASTTSSSSSTTTSTSTTAAVTPSTTTTAVPIIGTPSAPIPTASDDEKRQFEDEVNIYSTPGFDDYVPAGSTVSVATRRTVTAASVVLGTVPTLSPRRRRA